MSAVCDEARRRSAAAATGIGAFSLFRRRCALPLYPTIAMMLLSSVPRQLLRSLPGFNDLQQALPTGFTSLLSQTPLLQEAEGEAPSGASECLLLHLPQLFTWPLPQLLHALTLWLHSLPRAASRNADVFLSFFRSIACMALLLQRLLNQYSEAQSKHGLDIALNHLQRLLRLLLLQPEALAVVHRLPLLEALVPHLLPG